jgi:ADP-heptose:LPS heptosyltransferase
MKNAHAACVPSSADRVLAVSVGGLGDAILFSPVLKALRAKYAGAEIHFLVASRLTEEMYSGCPEVDEVHFVDTDMALRALRSFTMLPFALHERHAGGYCVGVFATGLNPNLAACLKPAAGIETVFEAPVPPEYETDLACNVALAKLFSAGVSEADVFVNVSQSARDAAGAVLAGSGIDPGRGPVVAVYPSTEHHHRPRWPLSQLVEVVARLKKNGHCTSVLVVGSAEEGAEWREAGGEQAVDINLAGKLSIGEVAALLAHCRLLVGNDGGPVHLAAAMGCAVVDVAVNVPASYHPPGSNTAVLRSERSCCDFPVRPDSCTTAECIEDVTVGRVFEACAAALRRRG